MTNADKVATLMVLINSNWFCRTRTTENRIGRQAQDVGNKALNYGYAILTSYIWNALLNAGLEPYCGFFHTTRAEIKQCCALIFNFSLND
jgi:CRISPR/Cas system-associated endonuclease Cas1